MEYPTSHPIPNTTVSPGSGRAQCLTLYPEVSVRSELYRGTIQVDLLEQTLEIPTLNNLGAPIEKAYLTAGFESHWFDACNVLVTLPRG